MRFKAFSSAYDFLGGQYPHQSSNGRRELRATEKDVASSPRPINCTSSSRDRSRSKVNNADTAIHIPTGTDTYDYQNEDFQKRYSARRTATQSEGGANHQRQNSKSPHGEHIPTSPDFTGMDDGTGQTASPADFSKSGIHIPTRTSSSGKQKPAPQPIPPPPPRSPAANDALNSSPPSPETTDDNVYDPGARSSAGSVFSQETSATSIHTLPPLQTKGPDNTDAQYLEPVIEDDPRSWDLVAPLQDELEVGMYALEKRAEQLFSANHLRTIFEDPKLLLRFTGFLNSHRPKSIPILIYYLDALKALRAINYANAIAEALEPIKGQGFTAEVAKPTRNAMLEEKANRAFEQLVQEDLPAYVTHIWIQVVSVSIQRRITGTLAPHLREASEGLAEVFCLTDPSRTDNPIVFASEEFTRTTQYGMNYIIGRNCRFLQGPRSSPHSVRRLAIACTSGKEHVEVFVNYRRDGSPFMNLLMTAPLMDSRGNIRYFIGAQVDVSGLIKDCNEMEGLTTLLEKEQEAEAAGEDEDPHRKDEFQELSEMFNGAELDTVRKFGGRMHKEYVDESDRESLHGRPRLLLKDPSQEILDKEKRSMSESAAATSVKERLNGKLEGVYQHYLLIRPAPSLRILFTSPSLRVPGILQSPFLNRIGGSSRVRADLGEALAEGRGVTAKIRWLTRPDEDGEGEGRPRWIHCTPLLGHSGAVGVWMIVLVYDEVSPTGQASGRRFRQAPPVASTIGGKEWDQSRSRERKHLNTYDKENDRRAGKQPEYFHRPTSRQNTHARSEVGSPMPGRSPARPQVEHFPSANASEFSFNLKG
ncbi:hypothetical protein M409DRAFT_62879 [Zasmidium cellare ATCC 36951]|uniref:PAC domain-containing protein n=1 Tax=Zasmidium cellare ATCC 36951 TaxID=1080233 RepID=A0A6A6CXZ9_ZASCE|nr:uncharacterized protein M409DRAFT_62879 [Zasmidium cellare ATCC 36951]KAF2172054.1 hypothetical protein M409DRAFT_62879 [Zasmidium cellare ATCC 36951]